MSSFSGEEKEQKVERVNTLKVIFIKFQIGVTRGDCGVKESFFHPVRTGDGAVEKAGGGKGLFTETLFIHEETIRR